MTDCSGPTVKEGIDALTTPQSDRRGIICGYKVIISVITSEMVTNKLLTHGEALVNGDAVPDAIEKSAQSFVSAGPAGVGTHLLNVRDDIRRLEKIRFEPRHFGCHRFPATEKNPRACRQSPVNANFAPCRPTPPLNLLKGN